MSKPFRPQLTLYLFQGVKPEDMKVTHDFGSKWTGSKTYPTYRELKRDLKKYLPYSYEATVSRSRRGEWGEWFERWEMIKGKPKIHGISEGLNDLRGTALSWPTFRTALTALTPFMMNTSLEIPIK